MGWHQDLRAPDPPLLTTDPTREGGLDRPTLQGLTPRQTKGPSFSQPCQALPSQLDVCQQGTNDLQEQQRKCPMPRPPGKSLAVALASDGHIHRQLPSETETPENAGERNTGRLVRSFWLPPPRRGGREQGSGIKVARCPWRGEVRFLVSLCGVALSVELSWDVPKPSMGVSKPDIERPRVYFGPLHEWTLCGLLTLVLLVDANHLYPNCDWAGGFTESQREPPCSSQPLHMTVSRGSEYSAQIKEMVLTSGRESIEMT